MTPTVPHSVPELVPLCSVVAFALGLQHRAAPCLGPLASSRLGIKPEVGVRAWRFGWLMVDAPGGVVSRAVWRRSGR